MKILISLAFFGLTLGILKAQTPASDTLFAHQYMKKASLFDEEMLFDSARIYYTKAAEIYDKKGMSESFFLSKGAAAGTYLGEELPDSTLVIIGRLLPEANRLLKKKSYAKGELYYLMGMACEFQNRLNESLDFFRKAADAYGNTSEDEQVALGFTHNNIAFLLREKGELNESLFHYQKCLEIRRKLYADMHHETADTYAETGMLYAMKSDYENALKFSDKALEIRLKLFGKESAPVAVSYSVFGYIYSKRGEFERAFEYYKYAHNINRSVYKNEMHPEMSVSYNDLGNVCVNQKRYDAALEYYAKALKIDLAVYGENEPETAFTYNNMGVAYNQKGEYDKALEYHEKALAVRKKVFGLIHPETAVSENNIGILYKMQDNYPKAFDYAEKAYLHIKAVYGEKHPDVSLLCFNLGDVFFSVAQYDSAARYFHTAASALSNEFSDTDLTANPEQEKTYRKEDLMLCLLKKGLSLYEVQKTETAIQAFEAGAEAAKAALLESVREGDRLSVASKAYRLYSAAALCNFKFAKK